MGLSMPWDICTVKLVLGFQSLQDEDKQADLAEVITESGSAFFEQCHRSRLMREESRFSYIEVLITAIVLGLVGMTAIPKFIEASEESRIGEIIDGLQTVRSQLALYRVQHEDRYPPTRSFEDFKCAMTKRVGQFGPYVRKIPVNPCNGLDTVRFDGEPAGANQAGWRFDTKTGLFQADNNAAYATL